MKTPGPRQYVSTSQVAESLGVSVSTVKRWVEDDILPAHKTAGGHRKLLLADVLELARRSNLPLPGPAMKKRGSRKRRAVDRAALARSLYRALAAGDAREVRRILHEAYHSALPLEAIGDSIVAPAMHRIGSDWEGGRIDVLHEHRATQICLDALHELKTSLEARARRNRPIAVGGAVEGDYSELPTLLAQMVLLEAGWIAVNLGPNTPLMSFARSVQELRPKLVWISFSHAVGDGDLQYAYRTFYAQAEQLEVAVMIGGRALTEPLRSALPYSAYGDSLSHLAAFAKTLYRPPNLPKRGRPKQDAGGKNRPG